MRKDPVTKNGFKNERSHRRSIRVPRIKHVRIGPLQTTDSKKENTSNGSASVKTKKVSIEVAHPPEGRKFENTAVKPKTQHHKTTFVTYVGEQRRSRQ